MTATNILLATTSLLIVVIFSLSFGNFSKNTQNSEANKQREELRDAIADLKAETDALRLSAMYQRTPIATSNIPAIPPSPATTPPPSSELKELTDEQAAQIEALQEQLAEKDNAVEKAEHKANFHKEEAGMFAAEKTRKAQKQARKEKRVRMALKMGTVEAVNTEWGFITFTPANSMSFLPGDVLGIRRGSGILGRVAISRQEGEHYVADIKANAYAGGMPPVAQGDELIKLPSEYTAPIAEELNSTGP